MKVTAIISEYNPLHLGHLHHIETTRKQTQADYVIAIMSGNFVQRGTPACMDKYARAKAALNSGVDMVIELPAVYATASAEYFAYGAVSLADTLGIVNTLSFGSESGSIEPFMELAQLLLYEPEAYRLSLKEGLRQGLSYPLARARALQQIRPNLADFLETPNNILGIEYCKALLKRRSKIQPFTISRKGEGYHSEGTDSTFASATGIRKLLLTKPTGYEKQLERLLPDSTFQELIAFSSRSMITEDDFSLLLRYKLLFENKAALSRYFGVTQELSNRIYKHFHEFQNISTFAELLKTKNITRTAINRALLHILLNIQTEDVLALTKRGCVDYIRVLGFRKEAAGLLTLLSQLPETALITNLSDAPILCETDIRADQIYQMVLSQKNHTNFQNEYQRKMLVV